MDRHPILDRNSAAATAPSQSGLRFPGEDGGQSLAEMAQRDLDAALQLLAERAQYITGASGAAIALRRAEHSDMLCRASAGSNAPELGALLSMELGLSGESVRTRQALRCDDSENDARVNREGCRQLGIASVVVMPILSDGQVLGVFELFSGRPHAFDDRDVAALQRLSEMADTAVRHSVAAQSATTLEENSRAEETQPVVSPKKPLFWSAPLQAGASDSGAEAVTPLIPVPAVLRNLQKCQACGFPVSRGRTICVECEEKQWRGQSLQPTIGETASTQGSAAGLKAGTEVVAPDLATVANAELSALSHSASEPQAIPEQPSAISSADGKEQAEDPLDSGLHS